MLISLFLGTSQPVTFPQPVAFPQLVTFPQPRHYTLYLTTEARSLGLSHIPFVALIAPT